MRLTQIRPFKRPNKEHGKELFMLLRPLQNESTELVAKRNLFQIGLSQVTESYIYKLCCTSKSGQGTSC